MTPKAAIIFLLCPLLAACSLAPGYLRPSVAEPPAYKEAEGWSTATPGDAVPRGKWWQAFGDPELDALEEKVGRDNQNLKAALARFQEARAAARAARAGFFPTVTGQAHDFRERSSPNFSALTAGKPFNDYLLEGDLSYEVDLWGRIRNAVSAAADEARASEGDMLALDLSLHAELAADYFALRGDDAAQAILDETVTAYQKALQVTTDRFKGGVAAETDVDQAQTQLQNAKTDAADTHLKRSRLEHAIAVLTGQAPATFALGCRPLNETPPALHPDLPSKLLERRPDIAAAERRVMAANEEIGVARAAWFPDFSLSGLFGFESVASGNWISAGSRIWSLGPSTVVTLFDAGRINALSDEARAAYDESAATYRQTVLTAYREVEDALTALHRLAQENESQQAATQAAGRALAQAQDRYTGGIVTYLEVVTAENIALQARLASADILTRRMTASVELIKALGGGWQAPPKAAKPETLGPPMPSLLQQKH